jgi:ankyrin repeat protein
MARKKANKQQGTLVPHRTPDLSVMLERATFGNARQLRAYLEAGGSPAAQVQLDADARLPLLHAIMVVSQHTHEDLSERIALLVDAGAKLDVPYPDDTNNTCTAVSWACGKECWVTLVALIQNGADINKECEADGYKPLHRAALEGFLAHCKILITHGAHVNAINSDGDTALHVAALHGHANVITYLIKTAGADVNACNNGGVSPLHKAAFGGHAAAVGVLMSNGADSASKT